MDVPVPQVPVPQQGVQMKVDVQGSPQVTPQLTVNWWNNPPPMPTQPVLMWVWAVPAFPSQFVTQTTQQQVTQVTT